MLIRFVRRPFDRRAVVLLTVVCFMSACHRWVPLEAPVEQTLAQHEGRLRLTLEDDEQIIGDSAWIAGDSVFVVADPETTSGVPLSDVVGVETRESNAIEVFAITAAAAGAVGLGVVAFTAGWEPNFRVRRPEPPEEAQ